MAALGWVVWSAARLRCLGLGALPVCAAYCRQPAARPARDSAAPSLQGLGTLLTAVSSLSRAVVTYSADRLKPNKKKTFKGHLVAGAVGSWLPAAAVRLPVDPVIRLYPPVIRLYPPVLCCCCRRL